MGEVRLERRMDKCWDDLGQKIARMTAKKGPSPYAHLSLVQQPLGE